MQVTQVQYVISMVSNTYCVCSVTSDVIQMKQWIQLLQETVYYWSINQFQNSSRSCTMQHIEIPKHAKLTKNFEI